MAVTRPIRMLLIANRGEIAVRIARTCRAMGIRTVAVYSDADAGAPHVHACDAAVRIGPPPAQASYLRIEAVLAAARDAGADAVHPGYGFLSENAGFADACAAAGLIFVGPPAAAIRAMGDKIAAKRIVEAAGVPTVPGYLEDDQSDGALAAAATRIGVPLLVKAAAGGGGKGMRVVRDLAGFAEAIAGARREAAAAFGDDRIFLERYVRDPRHIEIQVLADAHGACIHLGERECSVQRRHQKVLEETPSTAVSAALREEIGAAAVRAARAVGYVNAGTVEFMLDADGRHHFLEMNTRLQVEHAITEAVTGVDLVREQLRIAAGERLDLRPQDVAPRGHAIEVRIYAEDAAADFLPSTGRITAFEPPEGPGVRNDAGVECGSTVSVDYDPMLAKLIVFDRTRDACVQRLAAALDDYVVGGVATNIPFLQWLVRHEAFRRGETTTSFLDRHFSAESLHDAAVDRAALLAAAVAVQDIPAVSGGDDPWRRLGAWRHWAGTRTASFVGVTEPVTLVCAVDGTWHASSGAIAGSVTADAGRGIVMLDGAAFPYVAWPSHGGVSVAVHGAVQRFASLPSPSTEEAARSHRHGAHVSAGDVRAPMTGKIVKVAAAAGDVVAARQALVVMEAMKMEHTIAAPYDGTVVEVHVRLGDTVGAGDSLVEVEAGA